MPVLPLPPTTWRVALSVLLGASACSTQVIPADCEDDSCEDCDDPDDCDPPSPQPEPVCPLDCARPGDPAECGAPCEDDCELPPDLAPFELGTGEVCFERLPADRVVPQMEGPQGGYHMWLSLYCADCPSEVQLETQLVREDSGEVVGWPSMSQRAVVFGTVRGVTVYLPGNPWNPDDPPLPEGTQVVLSTSVRSLAGELLHEAQDTRVLGAYTLWDFCATNPEDPCCVELCDGEI
jgi:hypothetical protein